MSKRGRPAFNGKAVTIVCTDQERSTDFYARVLGAVPIPGDGYGCPWYRLGDVAISIMPNADSPSPASFPGHAMTMLWREVDDLDAARRHLAQAGVPIVDAPEGGPYIQIADPDGLVVEVWESDGTDGGG